MSASNRPLVARDERARPATAAGRCLARVARMSAAKSGVGHGWSRIAPLHPGYRTDVRYTPPACDRSPAARVEFVAAAQDQPARRDHAALWRAMDGGFPYLVAKSRGRVVGYAYAGRTGRGRPIASRWEFGYLEPAIHRRGIGLQLLQTLIAESEARGYRQDDRSDRRFRQRRIDRRPCQDRISDDRNASQRRLQIRPLTPHRDDAARAGDGGATLLRTT